MESELISIILPTHNGARYIKRAVASVMVQTYTTWELLIVNDGSTDDTKLVAHGLVAVEPRIRILENAENLGIQKTLNRGLRESRGAYIARIDDDDTWSDSTKLEKQMAFFARNKDYILVGTGTILIDEQGKELIRYLVPQTDPAIRNKLLSKNCFVHSSVLIKREPLMSIGGYGESKAVRHLEDYDLWLRLGRIGKLGNLGMYGVTFMLRRGGLSSQHKLEQARKSLRLVHVYRHDYPHYIGSLFRATLRIFVYGFLVRFPLQVFVNRLAKYYKEKW